MEEGNGGTCDGESTQIVQCNEMECAEKSKYFLPSHNHYQFYILEPFWKYPLYIYVAHCQYEDWTIGDCSLPCGGGTRVNTRSIRVSAENGGDECDGITSIVENCNAQECPGYKFSHFWSFLL